MVSQSINKLTNIAFLAMSRHVHTPLIFTFLFQVSQSFSIFFQILDVHIEMFSFVLILIKSDKCVFFKKETELYSCQLDV